MVGPVSIVAFCSNFDLPKWSLDISTLSVRVSTFRLIITPKKWMIYRRLGANLIISRLHFRFNAIEDWDRGLNGPFDLDEFPSTIRLKRRIESFRCGREKDFVDGFRVDSFLIGCSHSESIFHSNFKRPLVERITDHRSPWLDHLSKHQMMPKWYLSNRS